MGRAPYPKHSKPFPSSSVTCQRRKSLAIVTTETFRADAFANAQHWFNSITSKLKAILVVNRDSNSVRMSIRNKTRLPWVLTRKTYKGK